MTEFNAIIFDLDDTLYPEREFVLSGFRAAAAYAGTVTTLDPKSLHADLQKLFEQGVRGNTFQVALRSHGQHSPGVERAMVAAYRAHQPEIEVYPDVLTTLERLRSAYRIGLVSDGHLAVQKRKFAALCLDNYFDAVVFSDELGRDHWKPSIKPFQTVLNRLQITDAGGTVYVADNVLKDFLGARRLGMRTIHIRRTGGEYVAQVPPTESHKADLEISDLSQLEPALNKLKTLG